MLWRENGRLPGIHSCLNGHAKTELLTETFGGNIGTWRGVLREKRFTGEAPPTVSISLTERSVDCDAGSVVTVRSIRLSVARDDITGRAETSDGTNVSFIAVLGSGKSFRSWSQDALRSEPVPFPPSDCSVRQHI
jgi:hypothetical protein